VKQAAHGKLFEPLVLFRLLADTSAVGAGVPTQVRFCHDRFSLPVT
jgi:hypothetical protein